MRAPLMSILCVGVLVFAAGNACSAEQDDPVKDDAALFSNDALAEVNELIQVLVAQQERDVFIETIPSIPNWKPGLLDLPWNPIPVNRNTGMLEYLRDRTKQRQQESKHSTGVYVLFSENPAGVIVSTWPERNPGWFPLRKQQSMNRKLSRSYREKGNDITLRETERLLREQLQPPPPPPIHPLVLWGLVVGLIALWAVLALLSRVWPAQESPMFLTRVDRTPAVLGSTFGTPAASWVYDRLFQTYHPEVPQPEAALFGQETVAPE